MKTKKILSVLLVALMALALSGMTAFAGSITINTKNSNDTQSDATVYTWYKILDADVKSATAPKEDDGTLNGNPGQVAYYVTTKAQADAIKDTGLFNVSEAKSSTPRWYVELADTSTTAEQIATAFDGIKDTKDASNAAVFMSNTFTMTNGQAKADNLAPGYYLVTSGLGTKLVVQTLNDNIVIKEKNEYPSLTKTPDVTSASIGDTVTYTIVVNVPASVAKKAITVVDTIDSTLDRADSATVTPKVGDVATIAFSGDNLTIPAETVKANAGQSITVTVTAVVNNTAVINTALNNKAHLVYDNFTSKDVTATVKTYGFTVKKIDGASVASDASEEAKLNATALDGAKFTLWDSATGGNQIFVEKVGGVYRVDRSKAATASDSVIDAGTATIEGLKEGTFYLQEEAAPTGYNRLTSRFTVAVNANTSADGADYAVENNAGVQLPSTGALGTTIFYVVGVLAILGAGVFMVTNKRIAKEEF